MSRFAPIKSTATSQAKGLSSDYQHAESSPTDTYAHISKPGLNTSIVEGLSSQKQEPDWMREYRLNALEKFEGMKTPTWGPDLSSISFDEIRYYLRPVEKEFDSWDDVPDYIKRTFEKIGTPQAEREFLAGVKNQFDSEVVQGNLQDVWKKQGVEFLSMDQALQKHPDLIREHFGKVIPFGDNKFAALNTAVWSGGSFVYVPPGVHVTLPLQAYFRINAELAGQFERTLIIADEGSSVHYVEGCTSPAFSTSSLHAAVVEIVVKKGARVQYTTIQNWFRHVYNLVTKRAYVEEEGEMIWTDFNMGSRITMKYPSFVLAGKGAKGETLSMAIAGEGQIQDTGSKAIHLAPYTSSSIISKSISKQGGQTSYRGLVHVGPNAHHSKNKVVCDALLLDDISRSDTYPTERVFTKHVQLEHEASVSKIREDQLFYLMTRGMSEEEAGKMIVRGFAQPLIQKLPFEYAVEMNRLIDLEMEGSIG